jgi:Ca-activated chloride channel homolog
MQNAIPHRCRASGLPLFTLTLMLWSGLALASPSGALRDYKAGNYDESLKEYERLLERKGEDPRLHFNTGAAAYRSRQFEEAVKQFDAALASPDLKLQELAYYNRGNSLYWLGEQNPNPAKKTENWEKAVKDFENSMTLNPQDADAKFNHDFLKQRLEELKQQQQQQQQSKQDKSDQDKNQDQQQSQQSQQPKPDENQQQQQNQQSQAGQKHDSEEKNPQDQQSQPAPKPSQDEKDKPQQAAASPDKQQEKPDDKNQDQASSYAAGQMTPEQARQLLDAQKDEEQMLQLKPEGKPVDSAKPIKDW